MKTNTQSYQKQNWVQLTIIFIDNSIDEISKQIMTPLKTKMKTINLNRLRKYNSFKFHKSNNLVRKYLYFSDKFLGKYLHFSNKFLRKEFYIIDKDI